MAGVIPFFFFFLAVFSERGVRRSSMSEAGWCNEEKLSVRGHPGWKVETKAFVT